MIGHGMTISFPSPVHAQQQFLGEPVRPYRGADRAAIDGVTRG